MGDYGPVIITGIFGLITALLSTWFKHRLEKSGGINIDFEAVGDIFVVVLMILGLLAMGSFSYYAIETVFQQKPTFFSGILMVFAQIIGGVILAIIYMFPLVFIFKKWWDSDDSLFLYFILIFNILLHIGMCIGGDGHMNEKQLGTFLFFLIAIILILLILVVTTDDCLSVLLTPVLFLVYTSILSWLGNKMANNVNKILLHFLWSTS